MCRLEKISPARLDEKYDCSLFESGLTKGGQAVSLNSLLPQPLLSWSEAATYFTLGLVIDVLLALTTLPKVFAGSLINPDSYMRLVRLREMLQGHAVLHAVARDGSGTGTVLHWSHLLDAIIVLIATPLSVVTDEPTALRWAGIALGPIGVGLLGLSVAWVLSPITRPAWRWTAPVLAAVSIDIVGYGLPGVVHHHIAVAVAAVTTAGWAGRTAFDGVGAGRWLGLSAALGLWLSPETLPFTLLAFGGVGLAWVLRAEAANHGAGLRSAGMSFFLLIVVACAIDPPSGGYGAVETDRISIVYVMLGAVVFAVGGSIAWLGRSPLRQPARRGIGIVVGAVGIGIWFALFPAVLKGPDGLVSAEEVRAFLDIIAELLPITDPRHLNSALLDGVLATLALFVLAIRERSWLWAYCAGCGVLLLALGVSHSRFATYPAVLGAAMVPLVLTLAGNLMPARSLAMPLVRVVLAALFFLGPYAPDLVRPSLATRAAGLPSCDLRGIGPLLAPYAGQVVLADANETPELLYRTGIMTVGSLYHRNVAAFMRLRAAWRSGRSEQLPDTVEATRASLVLFCPHAERSLIVNDLPTDTLLDRLNRGEVPRWLSKIGEDAISGHVLYRIIR
jgi:hypothetical protein